MNGDTTLSEAALMLGVTVDIIVRMLAALGDAVEHAETERTMELIASKRRIIE